MHSLRSFSRLAVSFLFGVLAADACLAASPAVLPQHPFYPHPPAPVMVVIPKGQVSQKFLDGLKAGKPENLMLVLSDPAAQTERDVILQRNHGRTDDAEIRAMEQESCDMLKAQFLSAYDPEDLRVIRDSDQVTLLTVRIHDMRTLQRLQDDPRVADIDSGDEPYYPT